MRSPRGTILPEEQNKTARDSILGGLSSGISVLVSVYLSYRLGVITPEQMAQMPEAIYGIIMAAATFVSYIIYFVMRLLRDKV